MRRRDFVAGLGACAAHLAMARTLAPAAVGRRFAGRTGDGVRQGRVVAREPWGQLEEVAEGAWALISTPLNDDPRAHLTVANGGIVAGRDGVALIEGLVSEEGAGWLAASARELTGREPDHVILTHYHGDHSSGLAAHGTEVGPTLHAAPTTLELLSRSAERRGAASVAAGFGGDRLARVDERRTTTLDLGGRVLEIRPANGHTDSDLVVALEDPRIVWCGDLVWNGMVPNYVDATPSRLSLSVRELSGEAADTWVPGHGDLADRVALAEYLSLIDDVEDAARRGFAAGDEAAAVAAEYRPPSALGDWVAFSPRYYEVAFGAWYRELEEES